MNRPVKSREQRVAILLKGMPHVPPSVKIRFEEAFLQADPSSRGMPKALGRKQCARGAADGIAAHMKAVVGDALPGDLLLFRMRTWAIAKHAGVLVDANTMVHAHSRLGVIEERVTPAWWRRAAFVFRFPD